jgi:hypothetical protein
LDARAGPGALDALADVLAARTGPGEPLWWYWLAYLTWLA